MKELLGIGAIAALVVGGIWWAIDAENSELAAFNAKCLAAGKAQLECDLFTDLKRSSDQAAMAAGFAAGAAASSSAGRQ